MKKTLMVFCIFLLCVILGGLGVLQESVVPYPVEDFSGDVAYRVLRVIDGDTVEIDYEGEVTDVRLIGVNTPETVHPRKPVEPYGEEATTFVTNLLLGESVYLRFDVDRTDMYGRLLAYLYRAPDGLFVNLEIVRQGYGRAYTDYPFKFIELFQHYGTQAQTANKGIHSKQLEAPLNPQEKQGETVTVYVTRTGKKYHRAGCRWGNTPISLEEAKKRFEACKVCNPPR